MAMDEVFLGCAVLGGALFVIHLVLQFLGGHSDMDADLDGSHPDLGFKVLSFQGLTAFFTMFGLSGLALLRQSKVSEGWALLISTMIGLISMWVIGRLFMTVKALQSSGNMKIQSAIGQTARVYLTIKPGQIGKVELAISQHLSVLDARSDGAEVIPTDATVRVIAVESESLLVVEAMGK